MLPRGYGGTMRGEQFYFQGTLPPTRCLPSVKLVAEIVCVLNIVMRSQPTLTLSLEVSLI